MEFNVSFAGVSGIALNVSTLCQHRWNTHTNWSQSISSKDLLQMYYKRGVVEATLQALGLDHTRLPMTCDPGYRHTVPTVEEAAAKAQSDRMRALMAGEAPPRFTSSQPSVQSQQSSQSSGVPFQQPTASATRTTATARDQVVWIELACPARSHSGAASASELIPFEGERVETPSRCHALGCLFSRPRVDLQRSRVFFRG